MGFTAESIHVVHVQTKLDTPLLSVDIFLKLYFVHKFRLIRVAWCVNKVLDLSSSLVYDPGRLPFFRTVLVPIFLDRSGLDLEVYMSLAFGSFAASRRYQVSWHFQRFVINVHSTIAATAYG